MSETYLPVVTRIAVIGDHVLRLLFSDGTVGDVDQSTGSRAGSTIHILPADSVLSR